MLVNGMLQERRALYFDGVDDYVEVPDDPSLDLTDKISVTAWIHLRGYETYGGIVSQFDYSPAKWYFALDSTDGRRLRFVFYDPDGVAHVFEGSTIIPLEEWHLVTVTYDGHRVRFYINGSLDAESEDFNTGIRSGNATTYVGKVTTHFTNVIIALVCIYNRTLSEEEIKYNYVHWEDPIRDGLVLWLDSSSIDYENLIWHDKSGNNNDGQIHGCTLRRYRLRGGRPA